MKKLFKRRDKRSNVTDSSYERLSIYFGEEPRSGEMFIEPDMSIVSFSDLSEMLGISLKSSS